MYPSLLRLRLSMMQEFSVLLNMEWSSSEEDLKLSIDHFILKSVMPLSLSLQLLNPKEAVSSVCTEQRCSNVSIFSLRNILSIWTLPFHPNVLSREWKRFVTEVLMSSTQFLIGSRRFSVKKLKLPRKKKKQLRKIISCYLCLDSLDPVRIKSESERISFLSRSTSSYERTIRIA